VPFYFINLLPTSLLYISILLLSSPTTSLSACCSFCPDVKTRNSQKRTFGNSIPELFGNYLIYNSTGKIERGKGISVFPTGISAIPAQDLYMYTHLFPEHTRLRKNRYCITAAVINTHHGHPVYCWSREDMQQATASDVTQIMTNATLLA
jgi:hypothetical protein